MKREYQSILQNGIERKYLTLEEEIEKDIIRRIQKAGKITSTADWQIQRYLVLGHSTEDVENIIRKAVGGDWADTFELYDEVIEREYVRSKAMYEQVNAYFVPYEQNYELQQLTNALIQQSNDELYNISKSLGFMVDMGNGRKVFTPLSDVYNGYLDNAIIMLASGAFDYNTLIRKVAGELSASGLRTIDYASGRSNRVDVAVRRALLTGMGQLTGQISRMNGQALGTDKYEVDWHPGARPEHVVWQGRVWTYQQLVEVCGLGSGIGLLGWNCRHSYYPFIEGISARNYSDEWLEEMDRKEAEKRVYRGREYNTYEATQKQRQMETAMRAQREKAQMLKQGGADPDDVLNARCKYQAMLDEYKEFSKKFNLPEQRERIYADLRGRVAPSRRTYKKWQAEQAEKALKRIAEKERKAAKGLAKLVGRRQNTWASSAAGKSFTSKPDAFKHFANYGIRIGDSKKYPMDEKLAIRIAEWHSKFAETYPNFMKSIVNKIPEIKNVAPSSLKNGVLGQFSYYRSGKVDGIKLNAGLFSSLDYATHTTAEAVKRGWQSGENPIHTFIHEWGHYVSHSMGELQKGFEHDIIKKSLAEYKMSHPEYAVYTYRDLKEAVSKYGASSEAELFAECFAEYYGEKTPREFASIFGRIMEESLKAVK